MFSAALKQIGSTFSHSNAGMDLSKRNLFKSTAAIGATAGAGAASRMLAGKSPVKPGFNPFASHNPLKSPLDDVEKLETMMNNSHLTRRNFLSKFGKKAAEHVYDNKEAYGRSLKSTTTKLAGFAESISGGA